VKIRCSKASEMSPSARTTAIVEGLTAARRGANVRVTITAVAGTANVARTAIENAIAGTTEIAKKIHAEIGVAKGKTTVDAVESSCNDEPSPALGRLLGDRQ